MANLNVRTVVAVDGLAGSGKTTLSRLLAGRLGFAHLNSGLIYRAVAWLALDCGVDPADEEAVCGLLSRHLLLLKADENKSSMVLIDGVDIANKLHTPEVSQATSIAAAHQSVRHMLIGVQRNAFYPEGLVAEGRDMGSVVFPDAVAKFFIQAQESVRVNRRLKQLGAADGLQEKMNIEISERDRRDAGRKISPAVAASDAVLIDNSARTIDEVLDEMYSLARSRIEKPGL